ncbi:M16 family metallopeptidase [Streptomyces sp. NPDC097595]|uniref:M16 family metallopeptidase n=1 Tax=Streptomyces sp. NPDC097595 TaxID=3366090 RepID=UPI0038161CE8
MTRLRRLTLTNGLRVLLAPASSASVVAVAVHYDVGFRSEPEGRSGFAHLFEHLMFQGSARYPKLEHWSYVQGLGGTANGSTHQDYTDYYQLVPERGLAEVLAMEADRMGFPLITDENLRNQRAVVKEEVGLNILNRAYGGFPWIPLPALLYRSYANTHNGYGEFTDLDRATVDEARDFHATYYAPSNAVLSIAGAFDEDAVAALVENLFGGLPARPKPEPALLSEPPPLNPRHGDWADAHASGPALALGHQLPDPARQLTAYVAWMTVCELLTGGPTAPLEQRLVRDTGLALRVTAGCGLFDSLDARAPDTLALVVTHHDHAEQDALLTVIDEEIERLTDPSTAASRLPVATGRLSTRVSRRNADPMARTRALGACELLHGRAAVVDELPSLTAEVTAQAVADAAGQLLTGARAVLRLVPGRSAAGADGTTQKAALT